MATVISLTEAKIRQLMAGWQQVGLSQDEINALVIQLISEQETQKAVMTEFNEVTKPRLESDLAAGSIRLSEITGMVLPGIEDDLAQTQTDVQNLNDLQALLQQEVSSTSQVVAESPQVYVRDTEPGNPDESERYLVVGDMWFNTADDNKQLIWNGTEWTTFKIEISDFSLTVKKFMTSSHMIY